MTGTESNWYHLPTEWHDFIGCKEYGKKVNYTLLLKAIYDFAESNALYSEIDGESYITRIDEYPELEAIFRKNSIAIKDIDEQLRFFLEHIIQQEDGSFILLWDYVKHYPRESEETLKDFHDRTGICLYNIEEHEYCDIECSCLLTKSQCESPNLQMEYVQLMNVNLSDRDLEYYADVLTDELGVAYGYAPKNLKMKYLAPILHLWYPPYQKCVSGFAEPRYLSNELCDFLGVPRNEKVARTEVTRRIITYIKENSLENPEKKRIIIPDAKLERLVGNEMKRYV